MARFSKEIVSEGRFFVSDEHGGRRETTITRDQLLKWVTNFGKMRAKGYNIPAPWGHDLVHGVPVRFGRNGAPKPLENAGFVEDLRLEFRDNAQGEAQAVLIGDFDVPGDPNDANSPAGKIGRTVKETSVYVRPGYIDGTGETYDEAPMHVALVTHPIEPGQKNFVSADGFAIAMSQMVMSSTPPGALADQIENQGEDEDKLRDDAGVGATTNGGGTLGELISALRDAKIMDLPDNTTEDTVLQYMLVAVRQNKLTATSPFVPSAQPQSSVAPAPGNVTPPASSGAGQLEQPPAGPDGNPAAPPAEQPPNQSGGGFQPPAAKSVDLRKPPKAGVEQAPSIAMSQTPEQIVMSQQIQGLTSANQLLAAHLTGLEAEKRTVRIANLVSSGRCSQEYADKKLTPLLAGFAMSLGADGKPAPAAIDTVLEALEGQPARIGSTINSLGNSHLAGINVSTLPESTRNAVAAVLMSSAGANVPAGAIEQSIGDLFASPGVVTVEKAAEISNSFLELVNNG